MQDTREIAAIKVNLLKSVSLMTTGFKILCQSPSEEDSQIAKRLQDRLLEYNFLITLINQTQSNCVDVYDLTYLLIGFYIKNGLTDIANHLIETDNFN